MFLFLFGFSTIFFLFSQWNELAEAIRALFHGEGALADSLMNFAGKLPDFLKEYSSAFLWVYALFIAGIIFLEEKNPDRTIAWVM
ncbi:MAG: hypothetical protein GX110_10495, partial [Synergistaceae bacterium]|nr:hypothetical protein [Synergistaceae bacterium]